MRILLAFLLLSFLILAVACGEDDDGVSDDGFYDTQVDAPVGGAHGPMYKEPIPVTEGNYYPDDFDHEAAGDAINAGSFESRTSIVEVAGFRVLPFDVYFSEAGNKPRCDVAEFKLNQRISFTYLPPGTSLEGPQYDAVCADGSLLFSSQSFVTLPGFFVVTYNTGELLLQSDATDDRISEATISGRDAVVIEAPGKDGYGLSIIAWPTDEGFITLQASNLPSGEALGIVEGLKCVDC